MIGLAGLPEPPAREGWWDPETLSQFIADSLPLEVHSALEMRDTGGTREDWIYLADLRHALALRAWEEIEGKRKADDAQERPPKLV